MVECVEQMVYKGYERVTNGRCVQVGWGYWVSPGRGLWDGVVCWYGMLEAGFELAYGQFRFWIGPLVSKIAILKSELNWNITRRLVSYT